MGEMGGGECWTSNGSEAYEIVGVPNIGLYSGFIGIEQLH